MRSDALDKALLFIVATACIVAACIGVVAVATAFGLNAPLCKDVVLKHNEKKLCVMIGD